MSSTARLCFSAPSSKQCETQDMQPPTKKTQTPNTQRLLLSHRQHFLNQTNENVEEGHRERGEGRGTLGFVQFANSTSAMGIQTTRYQSGPLQILYSCRCHAFQDLRFRDAFIASDIEQGVCRTLISLFLQSRTNRPLKPGEGRVRELEKEESYSY